MTDWKALCAELLHAEQLDWEDCEKIKAKAAAALAQPEPAGPTDEEVAAEALQAVEAYESTLPWESNRYGTELTYALNPKSSEYLPMMLALRAVLKRWGR
ncbi:MAG: hypothetical protein RLZZ32_312 [Cyanobacteriota bacterium]|jgi:hypothetical protein